MPKQLAHCARQLAFGIGYCWFACYILLEGGGGGGGGNALGLGLSIPIGLLSSTARKMLYYCGKMQTGIWSAVVHEVAPCTEGFSNPWCLQH